MSQPSDPTDDARSGEPGEPRPHRSWRIFAIPAFLALFGYLALYSCDARMRSRYGPWEVEFRQAPDGIPAIRISQPGLGIREVEVRFAGERLAPESTNGLPVVVRFEGPLSTVPFGRTAFDDLMYLPGTVVLHCFGHEVQMVPRTLYLNRRGFSWTNEIRYDLQPAAKLPTLDPPPKPKKRMFG